MTSPRLSEPRAFESAESLEVLHGLLRRAGLGAGWNKPSPSLYPAPKREFVPAHWAYPIAKAALASAGRYVSTDLAERRNLILANPIPGNTYATARTMVAAYQMVKAGEAARSHRHTPNALRLAIDTAAGVYTIVQGEKIPMMHGDVLLTPNWMWHGHQNDSLSDAYWIDFLDAPLVQYLDPMFFEHYPEFVEPVHQSSPLTPMRHVYADTKLAVRASTPVRPGERWLRLGPAQLETMDLYLRHFEAPTTMGDARTTANRIYAVIEGTGSTTIGDRHFPWARGDVMVIPSWNEVDWEVTEEAVLLLVTDAPVFAKLKWLYTAKGGGE